MLLEVESVEQSFRSGFWMKKIDVLKDISLSVPEKSIFGFLGANGAGKTTLIQLLVGIRRPKSGSVRVAGYEAHTVEARRKIGYLPERPYFHEHLTGEGLLRYFGTLAGMRRAELNHQIPHLLDAVSMSHAAKVELRKYSKGMLQRIAIAQAMLQDPKLLVLDEPMSGLDPLGRKEMRELILRFAREGRTIFFSTHVIPDVEAICDQVAVIQKGRIIESGSLNSLLSGGPERNEIIFSGVPLDRARNIKGLNELREMPESLRGVAESRNETNLVLKSLIDLRGVIHSVTPIRPSLEDVFK